ncbi:MAG: GH39 family glycosyl hydrolase [Gemmatimonadaceae bacterium]
MKPVEFRCDLDGPTIPLPHNWEHTIGSDHAAMALRAEYREQLARCNRELGIGHVRFHGLLSRDMGALSRQNRMLVSSFYNAHSTWDFLLSIGMKPFVELSFMPEELASGRATVFHYLGNVTPPRRYSAWADLVRDLATSALARYGAAEVSTWPFEVWNEPNLRAFWRGTRDQYWRLYGATARALKTVHPDIPVGGPATAQNAWIEEFLEMSEREELPVDFVSTHHYPNDAFAGSTMDTETQLAHAQRGFLREQAQDARRRARGKPLYYTEWNASSDSRFPLHDESYAAAFIVKTLLDGCGLADVYSFWTFSDLFEENAFPAQPFHGGFGLLTIHGVAKPSYRAFEYLHKLGTKLVTPVDGTHPTVDAWVVRNDETHEAAAVVTNHTFPRHEIVLERVLLHLTTTRRPRSAAVVRIDDDHGNAKRCWMEMGSPQYPSRSQVDELHAASVVDLRPHPVRVDGSVVRVEVDVPPQGLAMVFLTFAPPDSSERDR